MPIGGGGGGGSAGDIQAGGAFVRIYSKDDLSKTLDKLKAKFNSFGKFINSVGNQAALGGAAIMAPLTALFAGGLNRAANVGKLAEQFGVSAEQMSRFAFAAEDAGVSLEEVINNQERFAGAMKRAPIFDSATAGGALEAQRAFKDSLVALQVAMLPVLKLLLPIVQGFAAFVKQNASLVMVAAAAGAGLLAFAAVAKTTAAGMAILTAGITALKFVMLALATPQGALLAGAIALGAYLLSDTQTVKDLGAAFQAMADTAKEAWGGIVAALAQGDLELAGQIALKGLEVIWLQTVQTLTQVWVDFKKSVVDTFHDLTDEIAKALIGVRALLMTIANGFDETESRKMVKDYDTQLKAMRRDQDDGNRRFRQKQIDDARAAVAAAKSGLGGLVAKANVAKPQVSDLAFAALNSANTKGAFQGPLSQQLGIGDSFQKKLLANTDKANGLLDGILKELAKKNGMVFG